MINYVGIEFKRPSDVYLEHTNEIIVREQSRQHLPYYALISRVEIIVGDPIADKYSPPGNIPLLDIIHYTGRGAELSLLIFYNKANFLCSSCGLLTMSVDYNAQFDEYIGEAMPKLINI